MVVGRWPSAFERAVAGPARLRQATMAAAPPTPASSHQTGFRTPVGPRPRQAASGGLSSAHRWSTLTPKRRMDALLHLPRGADAAECSAHSFCTGLLSGARLHPYLPNAASLCDGVLGRSLCRSQVLPSTRTARSAYYFGDMLEFRDTSRSLNVVRTISREAAR